MKTSILFLSFLFAISSCSNAADANKSLKKDTQQKVDENAVAYFASGCFWCVEAIFESVEGVGDVISGYSGGKASTAKYDLVSAGRTDHAEAVAVHYDSTKIDYRTLLKVFFGSHDPTTLNQQGPDKGRQYRSAIFYQNEKEKQLAENYIQELLNKAVFFKITTEVAPYTAFYKAESYHQNYEHRNPNNSYIKAVSIPRLNKFKSNYPDLLKTE
ncbi:peptide-methionine (S)-S-oxide reductase MsrA [Brumimicrobium aurantiacum]|uniref:Peptide methionine sulfoxide reductase MsrA n=1 Tax=Brumimicrobium aurantiacum TaxID=1737063 RepID=A0A3E1EXI8_9FLAO|nr:peptide-methionine (S)-S-oxide reductase MsrA [Brumimicrobium aurantiacum]RFC54257.1 peptide-methionine (S)-S-oxide reductase [Brumimicrobium aurantiacum]